MVGGERREHYLVYDKGGGRQIQGAPPPCPAPFLKKKLGTLN